MRASTVKHYVFYTNADEKGDIEWPEDDDVEYGIHTKSAAKSAIGSYIWVISGRGAPKEFSLCYSFLAEKAEPLAEGKGNRISGEQGAHFDPPWRLNEEPWLAALHRTQFWSLGLFELQSDEVIEGLVGLLDNLADEDVIDGGELPSLELVNGFLEEAVGICLSHSQKERLERLQSAPTLPERIEVITTAFLRNPDVIAEVLHRAKGICGKCGKPAPFTRKSNGTPYLEVHHWIPLSEGGEDTVENAGALCPNCHRQAHHG